MSEACRRAALEDALAMCERIAAHHQLEADAAAIRHERRVSPLLQKSGADQCVRAIKGMIAAMPAAAGLALLLLAAAAHAEQDPKPGKLDKRMQTVVYNPGNVTRLFGQTFGSTEIMFGEGETITHIAIGDADAWLASPTGNLLFLKPVEVRAPTPMQVVTTKKDGGTRSYVFELIARAGAAPAGTAQVASLDPSVVPVTPAGPVSPFAVAFTYPGDRAEAARAARDKERQTQDDQLAQSRLAIDWFYGPRNWRYGAQGATEIEPAEVSDNGRLTAMRFPGNSQVPTVFYRSPDGQETIASYRMQGDVLIVNNTAPEFYLRYGNSVTRLINYGYSQVGYNPGTGTTSPDIVRTVRSPAQ